MTLKDDQITVQTRVVMKGVKYNSVHLTVQLTDDFRTNSANFLN